MVPDLVIASSDALAGGRQLVAVPDGVAGGGPPAVGLGPDLGLKHGIGHDQMMT